MKEQIIQLECTDDIVTIIDKLSWLRAQRVLLVMPAEPGCQPLRRKLDVVLVQREVSRFGAELAFITRDDTLRELAHELGLPCFNTIEQCHRQAWRSRRAASRVLASERMTPLSPELVEAAEQAAEGRRELSPAQRKAALARLIIGSAAALSLTLLLVVPSAEVQLDPASDQISISADLVARTDAPGVDATAGVIPARLVGVEVEGSLSVESTGSVPVPSQPATGEVEFVNLRAEQVTIPAGTIVTTSGGQPVRFVTLQDVTLPGQINASAPAPIEALEPGFEGNVPATRINAVEGPLAAQVAAANPGPTRGGAADDAPAVTVEDRERVRNLLLQQLQQRAFVEMQTDAGVALGDEEFVPVESLQVVLINVENYYQEVGEQSDQLRLDMQVVVQGLAVDERAARQVVYERMSERLPDDLRLVPQSVIFRRGSVTESGAAGVVFVMQGAGDVVDNIDTAAIRRLTWGRAPQGAARRLEQELRLPDVPSVTVWPAFWPLMPLLPGRVEVTFQ